MPTGDAATNARTWERLPSTMRTPAWCDGALMGCL